MQNRNRSKVKNVMNKKSLDKAVVDSSAHCNILLEGVTDFV
ncbi:MAG: hypothetical protein ACJAW2_002243 [Shewanella sp.]